MRAPWLLGLLLRVLVVTGIEVLTLLTNPTASVGVGLIAFVVKVLVVAGWAFTEGRHRLSSAYALSRWAVVLVLTGLVAPVHRHLGTDRGYLALATDVGIGLLVFGAPVLLAAAGGWAVGTSVRRRPVRTG